MRLEHILTLLALSVGCRTPDAPQTAQVKTDEVVAIPAVPGEATAKSMTEAIAYWVERGDVIRASCPAQGEPKRLAKVDKTGCKVLAKKSVADFKKAFTELYLKETGKPSLSRAEAEMLDAAIATASIDNVLRSKVKKLPEGELDDLIAKYFPIIEKAMGTPPYTPQATRATGANLTEAPFLSELVSVPFGTLSLTPAYALFDTAKAKVIKVKASGATCGAVITGVNIGQNQLNLGGLKSQGGGLYASNFADKALEINYFQVVMSQTTYNFGICTITAAVEIEGDGPAPSVSGYDFDGYRACVGLASGAACPQIADAVTDACLAKNGNTSYCGDCSVLCSKPVSQDNGGGGDAWKQAGTIFYNGGFVAAIDVGVVPNAFVQRIKIESPTQCPGASILSVRSKPPLFAETLKPTKAAGANTWKPNGGDGAVLSAVVVSLNGPIIFGGCQIPVYVQ